MAKRAWGNLNLNAIKDAVAGGIVPFEGKKGKYVPVTVWIEDQPDEFGNSVSITIYNKETKQSFYLGNLKMADGENQVTQSKPENDLPF